MEATFQKQSIKQGLNAFLVAAAIAFIGYLSVTPHNLPTSKIEEDKDILYKEVTTSDHKKGGRKC